MDASDLTDKTVALYGRFLTAPRSAAAAAVEAAGGRIARDLTRGCDLLAVGLGAVGLARSGALALRLEAARARGAPIYGEERLLAAMRGEAGAPGTLPIAAALKDAALDDGAVALLAAFDVIRLDGDACRFEDAAALRQAAALVADGMDVVDAALSLREARAAPAGRRQLVARGEHAAALAWEDDQRLTELDGQRVLPMSYGATAEDLFDEAMIAASEGDEEEAARLYEICARADRRDPIAPYNLANIQAEAGDWPAAILNYRLAVARDPGFVEAYYNLAGAYEATGAEDRAVKSLETALGLDPFYADAQFNLAQLKLKRDVLDEAKILFEAYLAGDPPEPWRAKAQRALTVIGARRQAG